VAADQPAAGAEMFFGAAIAIFGIITLIEPKVLSDNLSIASSLVGGGNKAME